jgi:DNA helicase II / ATP-dependent DNA helicase PcrA
MKQQHDGAGLAINAPITGTHIQIIACAGSGKTETVALRVAHVLANGVLPDSIVAFTFTEKAAEELKQRILSQSKSKCGQDILGRIGRMYVGTIHAYALQLLQTYAPRYASYDLIEEDALRAWVARHSKAVLGTNKWSGMWDRVAGFLHDADILENEGLWPKGSDDFSKRYREFAETLEAHRFLTFGRSINAAADELPRAEVRARVHNDVRFVIADEYQDINPAQEKLIERLVGPNAQLCVVGDDDQSIYQWRGSDVAIMQGFQKRYKKVLRDDLPTNRRSVPSIVNLAADFAKTIKPRLHNKKILEFRPQPENANPIRVLRPSNRAEEAETIALTIQKLTKKGWHLGQIAVLIRRWKQAPSIMKALNERGIAFDCGGGNSLFMTELGYLLAAGFLLGIDPTGQYGVRYGWRQQLHLPPPPRSADQWVKRMGALLGLTQSQKVAARIGSSRFQMKPRETEAVRLVSLATCTL